MLDDLLVIVYHMIEVSYTTVCNFTRKCYGGTYERQKKRDIAYILYRIH